MIAGTVVVAIGLAYALFSGLSRVLTGPTPDAAAGAGAPSAPAAATAPVVPKIKATLFFASEDGLRLAPVQSDVPLADGPVAQARAIVEAQLTAEPPAALARTIPAGVTLRGLFVSQNNEAFVDLDPSIKSGHPGGSLQELLTVYTIVNVLLTNLPTLQQVQILIDGHEADTLAGHVDLRRPLRKNEGLIQPSNTTPAVTLPSPSPQ
ncbi:MAG: GerMN domain-containing protein [Vicinamibacterales bacterium]